MIFSVYLNMRVFVMFGSEHPQTILKLSFGTAKMSAYANKVHISLFVTKNIGMFIATDLTVKRC